MSLDNLRITVYSSAHIYGEDALENDSTNDYTNDSTNGSTNQQWKERHSGWILRETKREERISERSRYYY